MMLMIMDPLRGKRLIPCAWLFLSMLLPVWAGQAILGPLHVDQSAPVGGDGLSWSTAFSTITDGVAAANLVGGGDVWVKEGHYTPAAPISLGDATRVYGGFDGTERRREDRDWRAHGTVVDGVGQGFPLFTADGVMGFVLDGLAMVGGGGANADVEGGGVNIASSQGEIRRCNFTDNQATGITLTGRGGGALVSSSVVIISECEFMGNRAAGGTLSGGFGGGMAVVSGSDVSLSDCQFNGNSATGGAMGGEGGALYVDGASVTVARATFTNNSASPGGQGGGNGGAVACRSASGSVLTNCTLYGNWVSGQGGGLFDVGSDVTLINCTFSANSAYSGGAFAGDGTGPALTNTILWGNSAEEGAQWVFSGTGTPTATNCNVEGETYDGTVNGNISQDPLFGNMFQADVHLQPGSPCINAGTAVGAPSEDIEFISRPSSGGIDIGAHEWVRILHVAQSAPGNEDGTTWETAFRDVNDALASAQMGDEVWVATGVYAPAATRGGGPRDATFSLVDGVGLYGGFAGNEQARSERDWEQNQTVLSGDAGEPGDSADDAYHVVTVVECQGRTRLDGFMIKDGKANGEGPTSG
ncbi:MAG: right-handed parallel beta-helix repeat-containing protein [Lentisphaerae bacterium]|nr:right-handed parallel beta-helix repeat-containing protein [Lentisphaerota bacterium]MBT5611569.1 right-handed parallel beta-helix repeat-containing protein [Lentisphaerota bacterium]MBT7057375.1 right-handed parallel beta-helix repeat-containing protein [Lentisphaerota bacterium]MBT7841751.1 right-handed parallel beta-helix repeat-containing protein [Lentisphaerota bacterium]